MVEDSTGCPVDYMKKTVRAENLEDILGIGRPTKICPRKKPLLRIAQGIRRLRILEVSDPILRRQTAHSLMGMILKVEDGNRTLMIFSIYLMILTFLTSYFDVSKDMVNILEISEKCPLEIPWASSRSLTYTNRPWDNPVQARPSEAREEPCKKDQGQ